MLPDVQYEIVATDNPMGIQNCKIVSKTVYGQSGDTTLHWHNALEMTLVQEGRVQYFVEGKPYEVSEGDFVFINSGAIHLVKNHSPSGMMKGILLLIPDSFLEGLVPEISQPYFVVPKHSSVRKIIADYMKQIDSYLKNPSPFPSLLIRRELLSIVYQLYANCLVQNKDNIVEDSLCKQILTYTKQHYAGNLSIKKIASYFNLQENYFCRYFKKETGMSYHQFLCQLRLQSALALLATGNYSETYCALEAGFSSAKILIEWCKRVYQCTPKQYLSNLYEGDTRIQVRKQQNQNQEEM